MDAFHPRALLFSLVEPLREPRKGMDPGVLPVGHYAKIKKKKKIFRGPHIKKCPRTFRRIFEIFGGPSDHLDNPIYNLVILFYGVFGFMVN